MLLTPLMAVLLITIGVITLVCVHRASRRARQARQALNAPINFERAWSSVIMSYEEAVRQGRMTTNEAFDILNSLGIPPTFYASQWHISEPKAKEPSDLCPSCNKLVVMPEDDYICEQCRKGREAA